MKEDLMVVKASVSPANTISRDVETAASSVPEASTGIEGWNHSGSAAASTPAVQASPDTLRHRWDEYDAYLFDIDGTLLHCRDAVHYFAFCDALTSAAGRPVNLDGVPVQGRIDPGILRDAFQHAGVPAEQWQPQLAALLARMGAHVEAHAADFDIEVLPGVRDGLLHLQEHGKLLGVGTGNLQRIGWSKLTHCGLRGFFSFGAFSDGFEQRGPMIAAGVAAARAALGNPRASVLVIGDTPGDIAAARYAGVDALAVATGIFPATDLIAADRVVATLQDLLR